jgi:hypothetical protein
MRRSSYACARSRCEVVEVDTNSKKRTADYAERPDSWRGYYPRGVAVAIGLRAGGALIGGLRAAILLLTRYCEVALTDRHALTAQLYCGRGYLKISNALVLSRNSHV